MQCVTAVGFTRSVGVAVEGSTYVAVRTSTQGFKNYWSLLTQYP